MYKLKSSRTPWGDYGSILRHGLVEVESSAASPLVLTKAGSFAVPISFPWPTIVVTDVLGLQMKAGCFSGYELRPVTISKVVNISWEHWNQSAEEPELYPAGGEPENYILKRKHSPEVAGVLPTLWEIYVPDTPGLQLEGGAFDASMYGGQDLARGSKWGHIFVSDRLASWLNKEVSSWISVEPITRAA